MSKFQSTLGGNAINETVIGLFTAATIVIAGLLSLSQFGVAFI